MPTDRHVENTAAGGGRKKSAGAPRWVKVFGTIGLVLVALVVVLHLTGHGMGAHYHGMSMP